MKNWEIIDGEHTRKVMWINHEIEMKLYYNGEDEIDGEEVVSKRYAFMRPPEMEKLVINFNKYKLNDNSNITVNAEVFSK